MQQGGVVFGKTDPGAEVHFEGRTLRVSEEGRFVFGFGRDFAESARIEVRYPDGTEIIPRIELRMIFGLDAGVRPIRLLPGAPTPLGDARAAGLDAARVQGTKGARRLLQERGLVTAR